MSKLLITIGLVTSVFSALKNCSVSLKQSGLRIKYGEDVPAGKYTFAVILCTVRLWHVIPVQRSCTASMIAKNWALTAAHCVTGPLAPSRHTLYVWYGNYTTSPLKTYLYSKVFKIIVHPGFRMRIKPRLMAENDISLVQVFKVNVRSYSRILPIDYTSLMGLPITYLGFGDTMNTNYDRYRTLQFGEGVIKACNLRFKRISNHIICIASKCSNWKQTAAKGDSGGPLLYDGNVVGVANFVLSGARYREQAFTPTSPYIDWIHNVVNSSVIK